MGSDLNVCANIIRFFLAAINVLFIILGIILIGVGSWLIATDDNYSFITGSGVISGAALLIIAGIVTVIICAAGILGALFKLRPILVIYAFVVLAIVILEIVAGILGFVFRNDVVRVVNDGAENAISLYTVELDGATPEQLDATQVVDFIQNTFTCCGYNNASDWLRLNPTALQGSGNAPPGYNTPGSGCAMCNPAEDGCMTFTNTTVNISFNVTTTGCINTVSDNIIVFASVTGAIGIVFGLLEIFGVVFALILCCCITSAKRQEVV